MLWVGTYSAKGGGGLYPLQLQANELLVGSPDSRIPNASYGVWNARNATAYFVNEQEAGQVSAWTHSEDGWQPNGSHGTGGGLPCYLALDGRSVLLAAANYADGALSLLTLERGGGRILAIADRRPGSGRGVDPKRQTGPHAHCAVFDRRGRWLYHVDLGLDQIIRHRVEGGRLGDRETAFTAPPGAGPRHLVFCPDGRHALLICELSAELLLLEHSKSGFICKQRLPTAPEAIESNLGGHLALAPGGRVLVTNRGHDSLVLFEYDGERLRRRGWTRTGGRSPRYFHLCGSSVLVAHEESGSVTLVPIPLSDDEPQPVLASQAIPGAAFIIDIP